VVSQIQEEHKLRVFENRVLRKIIWPKRKEMTAWQELHTEKLYGFYSSPKSIWVIKLRRMGSFGGER